MMPQKVDRGWQPKQGGEQEPPWAMSQKWQSQSQSHYEVDSKKGLTEGDGKSGKVQVGIDWVNTSIQKPIPKPDL